MTTFNDGLLGAGNRAICRVVRGPQQGARWINNVILGGGDGNRDYWQPRFCDDAPQDVPDDDGVGFTGGQCDTLYRVGTTSTASNNEPSEAIFTVQGPITQFDFTQPEQEPNGNRWFYDYRIVAADGVREFEGAQVAPNSSVSPFGPVRVDGQADDCGNAPVPPFPVEGVEIPETIDYDSPDGPVSIPVDITVFAPIVPVFAPVTVLAPVRIVGPNFNITGNIQLAPTLNFGNGNLPQGPPQPPNLPAPEDPATSPPTDEDEDEPRLIGVIIRARQVDRIQQTELDEGNSPNLFVPRLASVFFRTRDRSTNAWAGPFDVKTTSAYVPVPANVSAVSARVSFQEGWEGTLLEVNEFADFGA